MTSFPSFKGAAVRRATTESPTPLRDLLLCAGPGLSHKSSTDAFDVAGGVGGGVDDENKLAMRENKQIFIS